MAVYHIDPLRDPRWGAFVHQHDRASIVHTPGWLQALKATYGYTPVVYTTTPQGKPLTNGVVFCSVSSWLTGRRLVSLPFTDHCDVLAEGAEVDREVLESLQATAARDKLAYIELRARDGLDDRDSAWQVSSSYHLHVMDIRPPLETLLRAAHKTAIQQAIRRAEREQLVYEAGRSPELVERFYQLLLMTRRRHGIPPQPIEWFHNLVTHLGDQMTIRVASKDGSPIASIITIRFGRFVLYKYGCSDARFHNLGGMAFLLWKTIEESKQAGAESLDFGRSDSDNPGLIAFKERWGAAPSTLNYIRYSAKAVRSSGRGRTRFVHEAFARMPDALLTAAGRLLYKHIG